MSTTKIKVSNIASVTGTGNVVLSSSPTFTGTTATANVSYSGTLTGSTGILNIGSGQVYKDASGNVGIGTSSPVNKLDVIGTVQVRATTSGVNQTATVLRITDSTNSSWANALYQAQSHIFNYGGGSEALRIDSSGNVGIGTGTYTSYGKLTVVCSGTSRANGLSVTPSGDITDGLRLYCDGTNNPNGIIENVWDSAGATLFRDILINPSGGNVGVGTSSPVSKLTVYGDSFLGYTGSSGLLIRNLSGMNRIDSYNYPITANYPLGILGSYITLSTSDAERLRIDASGNVGIGTSSPICKLNVYSSTAQSDTYGFVQIENPTAAAGVNASYTAKNYSGTSQFMQWENYGLRIGSRIVTNTGLGNIVFTTGNDAERMRIDANGYLLKNTSAFISTAYGNGDFSLVTMSAGLVIKNPGAAGSSVPTSIVFLNGSGTAVGYIAVGASVTNFTNLSDYRLKKDVTQINNALDKVSRINPVSFIWKESGEVGESFIAHELQEECPIAVVGNKDDVNEDGSIRPQGVDASKLIPLLTAAIKELKTIIDTQQEQLNIQQQQINTLLGK